MCFFERLQTEYQSVQVESIHIISKSQDSLHHTNLSRDTMATSPTHFCSNIHVTLRLILSLWATFLCTEMFSSETQETPIDLNSIEISCIAWPANIQYGDACFVAFNVKNISDSDIRLSANDLFTVNARKGTSPSQVQFHGVPMCSIGKSDCTVGTIFFGTKLGIQTLRPQETKCVFIDRFLVFERRKLNPNWLSDACVLEIKNFQPNVKNRLALPLPSIAIVPRRKDKESEFIDKSLSVGDFHFSELLDCSGNKLFVEQLFPLGQTRRLGLRNWKDWKIEENGFSEGTYHDELRLGRILFQYLTTRDKNILNELYDWFLALPEIQRISYSRTIRERIIGPVTPLGEIEEGFPTTLSFLRSGFRDIYHTIAEYDTLPKTEKEMNMLVILGIIDEKNNHVHPEWITNKMKTALDKQDAQ